MTGDDGPGLLLTFSFAGIILIRLKGYNLSPSKWEAPLKFQFQM